MTHSECVKKLIEIGKMLNFYSVGRSFGKKYQLGNPDCVWYYKGKGEKELRKIAKGEKCRYLPLVAFEVPFSEHEKALRGSLMTLQLTNASAGIIVLIGKSAKYKPFMKKLLGRYSFMRFRMWSEKDVNELYDRVFHAIPTTENLKLYFKDNHNIALGEKTLEDLKHELVRTTKTKLKISGRSYKTGRKKIITVSIKAIRLELK